MREELQRKVKFAVFIIKSVEKEAKKHGQPLEICYSCGKDSDVILELAKMAEVDYKAIYKLSTPSHGAILPQLRPSQTQRRPRKRSQQTTPNTQPRPSQIQPRPSQTQPRPRKRPRKRPHPIPKSRSQSATNQGHGNGHGRPHPIPKPRKRTRPIQGHGNGHGRPHTRYPSHGNGHGRPPYRPPYRHGQKSLKKNTTLYGLWSKLHDPKNFKKYDPL